MYTIRVTDDTARVLANALERVQIDRTRDSLIARQTAAVIRHALLPDMPTPMRLADEPLAIVREASGDA